MLGARDLARGAIEQGICPVAEQAALNDHRTVDLFALH
jgi:hypothetical protein